MNRKILFLLGFLVVLSVWVGCKKEDEHIIPFVDDHLTITSFPISGTGDLSFQAEPYLIFNKKIDFEYYNYSATLYKFVVDSAWISNSEGQIIKAVKVYSTNKDTLTFKPVEGLKANTTYQTNLIYHIVVRKNRNDAYEVMLKDGKPFQATFESSFNTREYSYSIDTTYVEYAYPVPSQYHFLRKETTRGVMKLKPNQEFDLYYKNATYKVRFSSLTGNSWESNATYDVNGRKYTFQIPSDNLENQKIYKIEYIMVNPGNSGETVFLTYHFRTSKFNTFEEKINSASNLYDRHIFIDHGVAELYKIFDMQEPFDEAEGKKYLGLVRFEAVADPANPWMVNFFKFYDGLVQHSNKYKLNWAFHKRDGDVTVPPLNAITLDQSSLAPKLTHQQILDNLALDNTNVSQKIVHNISYYYVYDWMYTRDQMFNYQNSLDEWEAYYINFSLYGLKYNEYYYFKIKYVAGDQVTYTSNNWSVYY